MIQLINHLNSPQEVQSKLDKAFAKGYTLNKVKFGFRFFKKEETPKAAAYLVERETALERKYLVDKTVFSQPNVTVTYCLGVDEKQDTISDILLVDYYQHQKSLYSHVSLRLSIYVMIGLYALMFLNIIPAALTGWLFLVIFLFLLHRFVSYRAFYKTVFKPLLDSTNSIDVAKAISLVIVANRKLNSEEFAIIRELGNFEFSNEKNGKFVYKLLTLSKHKLVQEKLDTLTSIETELFATAR